MSSPAARKTGITYHKLDLGLNPRFIAITLEQKDGTEPDKTLTMYATLSEYDKAFDWTTYLREVSAKPVPFDFFTEAFDWATYLREVSAKPVPFDFFTEEQKGGTEPDKTREVCSNLGLDVSGNMGSAQNTSHHKEEGNGASGFLGSADGNTITFGPNHDYLQDRETFPLKRLLTIMSRLNPGNENILDYSGCVQVTDAVFFAIRQLISVSQNIKPKLSSVIGLRLVGCHFLTDRGVECIGECFPKVKKLYLAGCPNVTEASLAVLAEQCTQLETLDICGTNVAMLPRKLADCILVTDTCPMVSLNPPVPSKDMARVCVVRREGQSNTSVLRLLQGDKELAATQGLGFKPNLPCGKDCLINVIECSQATVDLFTSGWAVYIIPSELKDKTKIEEEAKSIFGIVQSILLKAGTGAFVVVGLNTAGAGVVPTDIIVERVQDLVKNHMTSMETKAIETDPERFSHQLQIDQMERERQCLKSLAISALEVNLDQKDKAVPKLTEHLATLCAKNPESKIFSKALGDFMQGFPEQGGKDFKVGVHTLSGAADILLQGTAFIASLEAQGAVQILTKVLDQLIEELGVLGLRGVTGKTLIPFSCLPDTTDISLAMTRITNFHLPLYVWKYGIVVQDGIVELLFTLEADIKPERAGKGGSLLIHFDGWTNKYDYWAEPDSPDLHPLGYMEEEQTAGTKPDKTYSVCFDLGLDYVKSQKHSVCTLDLDRTTVLENWVREQMSKAAISDLPAFVKLNPRVFCLLPAKLDLQFLRYPSLATLFQPDKQSLHMMCPGQNSMYHLVDHPGLNFSSLAKSYSGLELFLQNAYFLLLTNENTIPVEGSELCKGFETVPPEQSLGQHTMQLKTLLEEGFKSHNLGQRFSHSAEFTKVECRAHQSAHSAGLELTTFPTEAFKGMGSSLTWINFSNNKLEMLPTEFSTMFQNLTHLNLENNLLNTLPSLSGFK
nr:hypothetical protein BaRGS_032397 [Batillaria attramentaria]